MSWIQRFFSLLLPAHSQAMEEDSRQWFLRCLKCGYEKSYWELGGIRYKASGSSRNYNRCPNCKKWSWHRTYKKEVGPGTPGAIGETKKPPSVSDDR